MFIGITVAVLSMKIYFDKSKLSSSGVEVMAEVVRVFSQQSSTGKLQYYTRIELPDAEKTLTSLDMTRETQNKYQVGEKVKVVYDPRDPKTVMVGGKEEVGGGGFSAFLGVLFGLASAGGGFFWIARSGYRQT